MKVKITGQMQQDYRMYLIEEERREATIEKYMRDITKLYDFLPADKQVSKLAVIEFKKHLISCYKPASVNSMLAAVNGFLSFIGRDDCRVRQVRVQRRIFRDENRELTKQDYLLLLRTAKAKKNKRLCLLMQTICATGIRISELPFITAESLEKGYALVDCKNKTRQIFLPHKLCRLLKAYTSEKAIKTGPVFITAGAKPLNRCNIWKEMKALAKTAGIIPEKVFPHNLRHLFSVCFYQREKDIVKLADILGHSSIETTRIYTTSCGQEHLIQLENLGLVLSET